MVRSLLFARMGTGYPLFMYQRGTWIIKPLTSSSNLIQLHSLQNETGIVSDTVRPPLFEKARPFIGGRWDKQPDFVGPLSRPQEENKETETGSPSNEEVRFYICARFKVFFKVY